MHLQGGDSQIDFVPEGLWPISRIRPFAVSTDSECGENAVIGRKGRSRNMGKVVVEEQRTWEEVLPRMPPLSGHVRPNESRVMSLGQPEMT